MPQSDETSPPVIREADTRCMLGHLLLPDDTTVDVHEGSRLVLGASPECEVQLVGDGVAARHCAIWSSEGGLFIEDLGSEAGTRLNGEPVRRALLQHDDAIGLGACEVHLISTTRALRLRSASRMFSRAVRAVACVSAAAAVLAAAWFVLRLRTAPDRQALGIVNHGPGAERSAGPVDAAAGRLVVEAFPAGATVLVDGARKGAVPVAIAITEGLHGVRIEADDYEPFDAAVRVVPDATSLVHCVLRHAAVGRLRERIRLAPRDARSHFELGQALLTHRDLEQGVTSVCAALGLVASGRDSGDWERSLPEVLPPLYLTPPVPGLTRTEHALLQDELDEAFLAIARQHGQTAMLGVFVNIHVRAGRDEQAVKLCESAVARSPNAVAPYLLLARVYREAARFDEAEGLLTLCEAVRKPGKETCFALAVGWAELAPHCPHSQVRAEAELRRALAACADDAERNQLTAAFRERPSTGRPQP